MKTKRAKGWAIPGDASVDEMNVDVNISGVCTCRFRKRNCVSGRRCARLFSDGGSNDDEQTLRFLMKADGRKMPRSWKYGYRWKKRRRSTHVAHDDALQGFERRFFEACRPVTVEVRGR